VSNHFFALKPALFAGSDCVTMMVILHCNLLPEGIFLVKKESVPTDSGFYTSQNGEKLIQSTKS
jgi:hypothetical protein